MILLAAAYPIPGFAQADVLYDGDVAGKSLPENWGWLWATKPLIGAQAVRSPHSRSVLMDSTAVMGDQAGYFGNLLAPPPNLSRAPGFTIRFDVAVLEENHVSDHRAGFSVIAVTDDAAFAIELGLWTDEIWAQSDDPLFYHGEGVALDTTGRRTYAIFVRGDGYFLFADGKAILSGGLKNYSDFGWPYNEPNFLFFGDDTSSASAVAKVYRFDILTHTPGDMDGSEAVTIADAVIALQVLAGITPAGLTPDYALRGGDVDLNFRVGMPEALFILRTVAGF